MATEYTTTYSLAKPEVGASEDTWGGILNSNADAIDDLLDGTTAIAPNLTAGSWQVGGVDVTSTAAELNLLDGVTYTLTDLNSLTATVTELNYVDGVTSNIQTQLDGKQTIDATLTAYAGTLTAVNKIPYATATDTAGELDFVDEDDMASDSATAVPSQQSVKAYVDTAVTAAGEITFTGSAPIFGVRAFCTWDGTGSTGATTTDAEGNIGTLTKNGTGRWTVTFDTALPDEHYAVSYAAGLSGASADFQSVISVHTKTSSGFSFDISDPTGNDRRDNSINSFIVVR